jgi:hypothetical protein
MHSPYPLRAERASDARRGSLLAAGLVPMQRPNARCDASLGRRVGVDACRRNSSAARRPTVVSIAFVANPAA